MVEGTEKVETLPWGMLDRRKFLAFASAAAGAAVMETGVPMSVCGDGVHQAERSADDLVRFVNVLLGTGGHGHTFPGAHGALRSGAATC